MSWRSSEALPAPLDATALSDVLVVLDEPQLKILATWLFSVATFARGRAQALENRRNSVKSSKARLDDMRSLPSAVAACIADGMEEKTARARVAFDRSIPVETVEHYCRAKDRARARFARQARALEVARMYAKGATAAKIAAQLGISKRTVERVLKRLRPAKLEPNGIGADDLLLDSTRRAREVGRRVRDRIIERAKLTAR